MSEPSSTPAEAPAPPADSRAQERTPEEESRTGKNLIRVVAIFAWWFGSLFLAAGRLNWIRGWISVALFIVGMSAVRLVVRHYNAPVLKARAKWRHKDTKLFDKVFLALYLPLISIQPLVGGLDGGRYHRTSMPFSFAYAGVFLFALSLWLITWVMLVNPFAESSVRIQNDRGHTVMTSGPYRFVRHPMYVGVIFLNVANALIWGSVWALNLAAVIAVMLIWRTSCEDRTLLQELGGYEQYAAGTRYRLVPGLW